MSSKVQIKDIEGVGATTLKKLRDAGFYSVESIATVPARELMEKANVTSETALKILTSARKLVRIEFISAKEIWKRRKNQETISTGCKQIDEVIGGGVRTQELTEFWGEYGTGKTQLCMKLCIMVQQKKGGLEDKALYIDTEGTFAPSRITKMSEFMGLEPEKVLDNITYSRCFNSDHQMLVVDNSAKYCYENNIKLVVIDSLTSHWRADYIGREMLAERQQKLNRHLHKLLRLADIEKLAVVVTNQVQANPAQFFGDPNRPAGGHIVSHASTHRIMLRKSTKNTRIAKVTDSPMFPTEPEGRFIITKNGLEDIEL